MITCILWRDDAENFILQNNRKRGMIFFAAAQHSISARCFCKNSWNSCKALREP